MFIDLFPYVNNMFNLIITKNNQLLNAYSKIETNNLKYINIEN